MHFFTIMLMGLVGPAISLTAGRNFATDNSSFFEGFAESDLVAAGSNTSLHEEDACCCYKSSSCFWADDTECIPIGKADGGCPHKYKHEAKKAAEKETVQKSTAAHGKEHVLHKDLSAHGKKEFNNCKENRDKALKAINEMLAIAENKEKNAADVGMAYKELRYHFIPPGMHEKYMPKLEGILETKNKADEAYEGTESCISRHSDLYASCIGDLEEAERLMKDLSVDQQKKLPKWRNDLEKDQAKRVEKAKEDYKNLDAAFQEKQYEGDRFLCAELLKKYSDLQSEIETINKGPHDMADDDQKKVPNMLEAIEKAEEKLDEKAAKEGKIMVEKLVDEMGRTSLDLPKIKKLIGEIGTYFEELDLDDQKKFIGVKKDLKEREKAKKNAQTNKVVNARVRSKALFRHIMKKVLRTFHHIGIAKS